MGHSIWSLREPRARWRSHCSVYAISQSWGITEMSGKVVQLRQAKKYRNATSRSKGRRGNDAYRVREHLTEGEMDKLLAALKDRHGHRDWLIGLVIYRHARNSSMIFPWVASPDAPRSRFAGHSAALHPAFGIYNFVTYLYAGMHRSRAKFFNAAVTMRRGWRTATRWH